MQKNILWEQLVQIMKIFIICLHKVKILEIKFLADIYNLSGVMHKAIRYKKQH